METNTMKCSGQFSVASKVTWQKSLLVGGSYCAGIHDSFFRFYVGQGRVKQFFHSQVFYVC